MFLNSKAIILLGVSLTLLGMFMNNGLHRESGKSQLLNQSHMAQKLRLWKNWKSDHGKQYPTEVQDNYRFEVFKANLDQIRDHNSEESFTYKLGLTKFSDLTSQEFTSMYLQPLKPMTNSTAVYSLMGSKPEGKRPRTKNLGQSYDWCSRGACPPVGDMGQCTGGSYAWAAVEGLESLYQIKKNVNVSLSVEQVIQCSQGYGNNGCNGGTVMDAYLYNEHNDLTTTSNYPYTSSNGVTGSCNDAAAGQGMYKVQNVNIIPPVCEYIANDLQDNPIAICLSASSQFQQYTSGIFPASSCNNSPINLCLLLVGVQYENYWYLQNAWGTSWGMGGMMQLQYGNSCGICNNAWQPQFNQFA